MPIITELEATTISGLEMYELRAYPEFDFTGKVQSVLAINRNITERYRTMEALRHEADRAKTVAGIAVRLNASLELQEVLDIICKEIAHAMEAPVTLIWLVDAELKSLKVQAAFGIPLNEQSLPIPNKIHPLWQQKLENIYYVKDIEEIQENPNFPIPRQLQLHTTVNCWFFQEDQLIGVLTVSKNEVGWDYTDADLTMLQTLSNQIAIAVHKAHLYEQVKSGRAHLQALSEKLVDIQEAERRHLAIELHDEIGQSLTYVKMNLDRYDPAHPDKENLEMARDMTIDLMKRIRGLSLELRPNILDDLGLIPAILWHIERYMALTGIQVDFKASAVDRRFRPQVEITVYRILQESLTNIARHAGATQVMVSLWADEERLGLQVEDNGVGFDTAATFEKMTGGLSGMQERVNACGGKLLVDSHPGQGTYISMEIPLQSESFERRAK